MGIAVRGVAMRMNLCACGREKHKASARCLHCWNVRGGGLCRKGSWQRLVVNRWRMMMRRCYNPEQRGYERYGGRGIVVCERWHDVSAFVFDMGPPPPGCTLDRKDNDGPYSPENCRWATPVEQGNNTSRNRRLTIGGFTGTLTEHARRAGIDPWVFRDRIERGWTAEEAAREPVANQRRYMRDDEKKEVIRMRKSGLTIEAIANATEFSRGAIGRLLRKSA